MLTRITVVGLIIVVVTNGTFATKLRRNKEQREATSEGNGGKVQHFEKERTIRSAVACNDTTESTSVQVTYGDNVTIKCECGAVGIIWYDGNCRIVEPSVRYNITIGGLMISGFNASDSLSYICKFNDSCATKTDITVVAPVSSGGAGLAVFLIFLAIAFLVLICCIKKYNTRISLCMRDTCKPNDGKDGKVYDAYVSMGVTEADRRFVESFVYDVLKKKYGYNLLVDNKNLLPKLDYSDKLQSNLHKCRRLLVVFSPTYMTHDWCMYCFNEGLRKIVELNIPTIFVITDHTILSELRSHAEIIAHIPQILFTQHQSSGDRDQALERIRQRMPPPCRAISFRKKSGMRSPILSDAEEIHKQSDVNLNGNGPSETEYTFGTPPEAIQDEIQREYDENLEEPAPDDFVTAVRAGGEINPNEVKVHQYGARKDFYSLAATSEDN